MRREVMFYENPFASDDSDRVLWSVRAFYIFASYAIVIVRYIPDLRERYLNYGARAKDVKKQDITNSALPRWVRLQFDPVLDWLAELTVPHSWFAHFYICSSICSAYWLCVHHNVYGSLASNTPLSLMVTWELRTMLAMLLLQIQGLRRLYECLVVAKSSTSRMWIGHYLIGLAFYLVTNVAVWIEPASEPKQPRRAAIHDSLDILNGFNIVRVIACAIMFLFYSLKQNQVHAYLASLKDYRVPDHPIFQQTNLICPHYGFEVNLYIVLSVMTARDSRILNLTMLCATAFVIINLGITADLTKDWQLQKFPKQRTEIAARKRMLGSLW